MKKIIFICMILSSFIVLAGCSNLPKEDPQEVMEEYYENIKNNNLEAAWDMHSKETIKNFETKEKFIQFANLLDEITTTKGFKVEKTKSYDEKVIEGLKFNNIVEFEITSNYIRLDLNNKEETSTSKRYLINEDGYWKVYRGKENGNQLIASNLNFVANMYTEGIGKNLDYNQAAILLNQAIEIDKKYSASYYAIAYVFNNLGRFDESITNINEFIAMETDKETLSNAYNILGWAYEGKNDYSAAEKYYLKAVELDENNQYAKTNLTRIKELM